MKNNTVYTNAEHAKSVANAIYDVIKKNELSYDESITVLDAVAIRLGDLTFTKDSEYRPAPNLAEE